MTVDRFTLTVPGQPVPLARARASRSGFYLPARSVEFRERVQACWQAAGRPSVGSAPFALSAMFYRSGKRAADLDNLLKGVLDALNGLAFEDDSQLVCLAGVHKLQCGNGQYRTELTIWLASRVAA